MLAFLILFFIFTLQNNANAETILDIPVYTHQNKNSQVNNNAEQSQSEPTQTNINTESISTKDLQDHQGQIKSLNELSQHIQSGLVQNFGGENGFTEIHLRGARAIQPQLFFNGFPLSNSLNGNENFNLIPASSIADLEIYPDSAPFYLGEQGIGGELNFISCLSQHCFSSEKNHILVKSAVGSYEYKSLQTTIGDKVTDQTEIFGTLEATKSKENYLVFQQDQSWLHPEQGRYTPLENNDYSTLKAAFNISHRSSFFGKMHFYSLISSEEKGIPSYTNQKTNTREKQLLGIAVLQTEKFFPQNGVRWTWQGGGSFQKTDISNVLPQYANQAKKTLNLNFQAKTNLIIPSEIITKEQTGFSLEIFNSQNHVDTAFLSQPDEISSTIDANRYQLKSGFFESIFVPLSDEVSSTTSAQIWLENSRDHSTTKCHNIYLTQCEDGETEKWNAPTHSGAATFQLKIHHLFPYLRLVQSNRNPSLEEYYGSPGGIIPNSNIKPESSLKKEIGLEIPYGRFGIFTAQDENLIFLEQSSSTTMQYINLQNSQRLGAFLEAANTWHDLFRTSISYQYINSQFEQNHQTLIVPRTPKHTLNMNLSLEKINFYSLEKGNLFFSAFENTQWQSPFYTDTLNTNQMQIPPVSNCGGKVELAHRDFTLIFALDITNVTNERFSSLYNTSGMNIQINSNGYLGIPPPGRQYDVSLSAEF